MSTVPADEELSAAPERLWSPSAERASHSNIADYCSWLVRSGYGPFRTYDDLWRWSVDDPECFWSSLWQYFRLEETCSPYEAVMLGAVMPDVEWFPGATTNYARHALVQPAEAVAIQYLSETGRSGRITYGELGAQVAAVSEWLLEAGVRPGDRVVGYLPNIPEAVVAFLAAAAIGAVWAACAPDLGVTSVLDRFEQLKPKVLFAADGYVYAGRAFSRSEEIAVLKAALPSLVATVEIGHLDQASRPGTDSETWETVVSRDALLRFADLDWSHPLWILFTSGTTGLPKPIVHGHGGILIEHLKTHALHLDLDADDRFFWYTSTSWMMWNFLVSGLLRGCAIVLFDGSPSYPSSERLWQLAEECNVTFFGTSAPFIELCMREGLRPSQNFSLPALKSIGSTASPLSADAFRWIYDQVGSDILVGSTSGGTDVCTPFVGACPLLPVHAGEIQCRLLGVSAEAFDEDGRSIIDAVGELVITKPMPSMPLHLWNDPDGSQYRHSYFEKYSGVWRHGDWVTITARGSVIIHGRSDSTIKRGGIRTGTSEFYRVLDRIEAIDDSLVIDTAVFSVRDRSEIVVFAVPRDGTVLDSQTVDAIRRSLRDELSPRHVPDHVVAVQAVPRTLNGKKLELPVKRILEGVPTEKACAPGTIEDPASLAAFAAIRIELRGALGLSDTQTESRL